MHYHRYNCLLCFEGIILWLSKFYTNGLDLLEFLRYSEWVNYETTHEVTTEILQSSIAGTALNNLLLHSNSFSSISGLSLRNTLVTCKIHVRAERTQVGMYFSRQAGSLFKWFHMGQIKRFSGLSKNLWYLPEHFDWLISVKVLRDFIHMWKKVLLKKYFKLGPQFNLDNSQTSLWTVFSTV